MLKNYLYEKISYFFPGKTALITALFIFIMFPGLIYSQNTQPPLKPIYVEVHMHYEDFINPLEAGKSMDRILKLLEKSNIKLRTLEIRGIVLTEVVKVYPEILETIKRTKTPVNGNQEVRCIYYT